ncbi:MAG: bifunctional demethylmenaquinone methyltransferase/2-methoxy-6-polyprenyl-1,4-benzoquinol methylase UbiE [Phycisphaerae bacterium]|nr:bifunctional demethylmenaquinone methyltransferase/2-methoxy-6-polyprenyl-1,4-benzoquinol methylase UbiE [Phycisphaerae bacterium]
MSPAPIRPEVTPSREPAWSDEQLASNPHTYADKQARVQAMFAAIAKRYDLNNRLHSFGLDQRWRRRAVALARVNASSDVVDVACGTGDLSEAFADAGVRSVIGIDYTPAMLEIAKVKATRHAPGRGPRPTVSYREGDATKLDLPDASADALSIAFGIRNVGEPVKALREFHRVLRPGGRVVILEFSEPRNPLIRAGNSLYTKRVMPITATLIARDRSGAYRYLPRSVETFLSPADLAKSLTEVGFVGIEAHPQTFGVCTITVATKPA